MNSKERIEGQFKMTLEYYRPPNRLLAWLRRWFWILCQGDKGAVTIPVVFMIIAAHVGFGLWIYRWAKSENQQKPEIIWTYHGIESPENYKLTETEDLANYVDNINHNRNGWEKR